jgi:ElaB/YqjD/DUF883 family membrane-anchored ribosome-binding protein
LTAKDSSELIDDDKDAIKELRVEYERKLARLQAKFDKVSKDAKGEDDDVSDERYTLSGIQSGFEATRDDAMRLMDRGGEFVKDHPFLVVGGALTFGLLLGTFLGRTSRD